MQSLPLVAVDMMSAGPPASASTTKTGQDGIFAAQLEAASQGQATGQATTASQTKPLGNQENDASPAGPSSASADVLTAQQANSEDTTETVPAIVEHSPASNPDINEDDSTDDLTSVAPPDNSAGMTNPLVVPVFWAGVAIGLTPSQNIVKAQDSESLVSRILDGITSASNGLTVSAPAKVPLQETNEAIAAPAKNEAGGPSLPVETKQFSVATNFSMAAPETTGVGTNSGYSTGGKNGITQADNTTSRPQTTVSFAFDTPPAAETAAKIEQTPVAPSSSTPQAQSASPQTDVLLSVTAEVQSAATQPNVLSSVTAEVQSAATQPNVLSSVTAEVQSAATQPNVLSSVTAEVQSAATQPAALSSVTPEVQSAATQTSAQQNTTAQDVDQIVQNQYGQIITIHQANGSEENGATMADGGKLPTTGTNNQNPDIGNNYISSHLPNDASKNGEKEDTGQQQDTAKDNQQKGASTATPLTNGQTPPDRLSDQNPQFTVGSENRPLIVPQQPSGTPLVNTTPTADVSTLQLPSGLTVPGTTVVDQMIAHFSVNRRLESGIVNLKLTPQELGELRMEIKITQDNVKAHIVAQNPQAQEMIGLHLPRLRDALEQQGLHLQQVEVTIAANDNANREQFQGHSGQQQLNQPMQNRGSHPVFTVNSVEETAETSHALNNLSVLA